ncbi:MAG: YfhO family protein [Gemmatimonadales bacterium]
MYEPKRPALTTAALLTLWVAILALPMLGGQWLAGPGGDQYAAGYPVRAWEAAQWRATGHIPLWNPMIFGGLPYVATVGHGDVFYPTSFLRLVLPADVVTGTGFVLHYILAGLFTYLFLRRLGLSWVGAVVGGVSYQLSGILVSLPNPGHDGKLFVSTILPLALLGLHVALRERRWWGYGVLSTAVGLALLSPHFQMTYYLLIASGLVALYLTFGEPDPEPAGRRVSRLGLALVALAVGFGIAALQILPFLEYVPHSPRAEGYHQGFAGSASYAVPWDHVLELFLAGFTGEGEVYWGSNPIKLHSEYLGLPVVALAILGLGDRRRRLVWWLGGIGLLFLLISLGASTPFYRLWWTVMP